MNYSQLSDRHKKDLYLRITLNRTLLEYLYDNYADFSDDIAATLCKEAGKHTEEKGLEYIDDILKGVDDILEKRYLNRANIE